MELEPSHVPDSLRLFITVTLIAVAWAFIWLGRRLLLGSPLLPSPEKGPNRVSWGLGTIVLVLLSMQIMGTIVAGLYVVARPVTSISVHPATEPLVSAKSSAKPGRETFSDTEKMVIGSVATMLMLASVPFLLKLLTGARLCDFGLTSHRVGRDFLIGGLSFLVVTPVVQLFFILAVRFYPITPKKHALEKMLREETDRWPFIIFAYLSAMILAPLAEELIFRGLIQGWLQRLYHHDQSKEIDTDSPRETRSMWVPRPLRAFAPAYSSDRMARVMPILITSLFFAAVHYEQMPAPFAIFVLSLALGFLYQQTQRLLPSIVLHSLFNGFNTTILVLTLLNGPEIDPRMHEGAIKPDVRRNQREDQGFLLAQHRVVGIFPEG